MTDDRVIIQNRIKKAAGRPSGRVHPAMMYALFCILFLLALPAAQTFAEEGYEEVAGSASLGETKENLAPYGMTPVSGNMIKDGEYVVGTECSSSFFHIEEAKLTVKDGKMTALLTMSSSSYLLVYPGTADQAAAAPYEDYIPSVEIDTWDTFTIPVQALDAELDLAAFSKKKKKWYPRKILFHASDIPAGALLFDYPDYDRIAQALTLYEEFSEFGEDDENTLQNPEPQAVRLEDLPDGEYSIEVSLSGGSGRASVTTPTWLQVQDGRAYARLLWSSPYYDYMILDGKKYLNETTDGGSSTFTIPVTAMDAPIEIIADTTAMGDPVEIDYTLTFYENTIGSKSRVPQEGALRVLAGAAVFIIVGGIANHWIKKRRR